MRLEPSRASRYAAYPDEQLQANAARLYRLDARLGMCLDVSDALL